MTYEPFFVHFLRPAPETTLFHVFRPILPPFFPFPLPFFIYKTSIFQKNIDLPSEPALSHSHLKTHYFSQIPSIFKQKSSNPKNPHTLPLPIPIIPYSYPIHIPLPDSPFIKDTPSNPMEIPRNPYKPPINPLKSPTTLPTPPPYPLPVLIKNLVQ